MPKLTTASLSDVAVSPAEDNVISQPQKLPLNRVNPLSLNRFQFHRSIP